MSILVGNPFLLNTTAATGYQVSRSLRFNSADSAYLSRTPASAGNRTTWTFSAWIKRSSLGGDQEILVAESGSNVTELYFTNDTIFFYQYNGSYQGQLITTQVFRDPSSWFHLVAVYDTDNATAADRMRLYVNGSRITAFSTTQNPSSGTQSALNSTFTHNIGGRSAIGSRYLNGYLADIHFIDGQALTPSSFGETDATTGQWIPKLYSGSYGTNGFKLNFSDNSAATATTLGKDTSGNSNNWTPNNFSVLTGAGNNGNWRNKLSNITYYSGSGITQFDEHLFRGVADNTGFSGYSGYPSDVTWTPATPISYTSSVRFLYDAYPAYTKYTLNGGAEQTANGSWPPPAIGQWQTVATGSGTLTSLRFRSTSYEIGVHAIEIDGVVLKDINAAGNDSLVDTPTSFGTSTGIGGEQRGNYAVLNPLDKNPDAALANGNLDYTPGGSVWRPVRATIGVTSGKWYWEVSISNIGILGIATQSTPLGNDYYPGIDATSYGYTYVGTKYNNGSSTSYGSSYTTGDLIGVAYDADNGKVWFSKNGTWQASGDPAAGTNAAYTGINTALTYFPMIAFSGTGTSVFNAGQRAFAYTAPSGFKALVDTNLTAPVIAKPSTVMDVLTWSGSGGARSLTGLGFSPDLVWGKARNASGSNHVLYDAVRGAGNNKDLSSSSTSEEGSAFMGTSIYGYLSSFDSAGFSVANGTDSNFPSAYWNQSGRTYVAWAWDAGTSTVTNTQGSITSSVRASASSGFSIVTYQANAPNNTIGHGLGVRPEFVITKARTRNDNWLVYHSALGVNQWLHLNITAAAITTSGIWGTSGNWTSATFGVSTNGVEGNNYGSNDFVAYCFAPVTNYSSFGSYTGNGSASSGPFVYTGFRPRFLLVKNSNNTDGWSMWDAARDPYNEVIYKIEPNSSGAEGSNAVHKFDFLSNGFRVRGDWAGINGSGNTIIFACFAESPFQYARAR